MEPLEVMILGANRYSFTDNNTGNVVKGTAVHYIQLTKSEDSDKVGYFPTKATMPYEYLQVLENYNLEFPFYATASLTVDMSNKKNPVKITGFKPTGAVLNKK